MSEVIKNADLRVDADACWVVKDEIVSVEFARAPGTLESAVGPNRYEADDALLTGSTGDRWCVSRDRFDAKYEPLDPAGGPGPYRNRPVPVLARRMAAGFRIERSAGGDVLTGGPGDWLLQYAPGDHGVVAAARFERVYRVLEPRQSR